MKNKLALLASAVGLLAVAPVWAGTINFDFASCSSILGASQCPGDVGTSTVGYTDSTNTYYVVAHGVNYNFGGIDLFVKNDGGSENGLGLAGTLNDEINNSESGQGIIIDMSNLAANGFDSGTVWLGSLQRGESGTVCNLSSIGSCQTVIESGNTEMGSASVSWNANDPYLLFWQPNADGGNFLVDSLSATSAPEPGSGVLFGFGLAGLLLVVARRKIALGRQSSR